MNRFFSCILFLSCVVMLTACSSSHDATYYQHHVAEARQELKACHAALMASDGVDAAKSVLSDPECKEADTGLDKHREAARQKALAARRAKAEKMKADFPSLVAQFKLLRYEQLYAQAKQAGALDGPCADFGSVAPQYTTCDAYAKAYAARHAQHQAKRLQALEQLPYAALYAKAKKANAVSQYGCSDDNCRLLRQAYSAVVKRNTAQAKSKFVPLLDKMKARDGDALLQDFNNLADDGNCEDASALVPGAPVAYSKCAAVRQALVSHYAGWQGTKLRDHYLSHCLESKAPTCGVLVDAERTAIEAASADLTMDRVQSLYKRCNAEYDAAKQKLSKPSTANKWAALIAGNINPYSDWVACAAGASWYSEHGGESYWAISGAPR